MAKSSKNDFSKTTVATLEKRAGDICSNLDCKVHTSGPHSEDTKAVNLGEAAHIKGAEPDSARYDPAMTPVERSSITNGIWLCSRCHTLVDRDERRYTVDVLYDWKRQHEAELALKVSGGWERRSRERLLKPLENESPAAYQIALDQPDYWEFMLTVELLRTKLNGLVRDFEDLKRGLMYRPTKFLDTQQALSWLGQKIEDLANLPKMLSIAFTEELLPAWGEPGQPGDALQIKRAVDKIVLSYAGLLEWEIDAHFTRFPDVYEPVRQKVQGCTEQILKEIERMPHEIAKEFEEPRPQEPRTVTFTINLPNTLFELLEDTRKLIAQGLL